MQKINVFDTTLRDGEQSAGVNLTFGEKLEIARQLERLKVDIMEAGFPASSKAEMKSVREIARSVRGCSITGLARSVKSDIDIAWEALKDGAEPRLHVFLATSPIHREYKLKKSKEQVIESAVEAVKYAKTLFPVVQWSAEDACRTELDFLREIVSEVIKAGADVVNIPDTVGYIHPKEYGEIFSYLKQNVSDIDQVILSAHCHNDLGMAVANSLSAIEHGAGQVEGTINGIGERAGNAALEEIAVALKIRADHYQSYFDLKMDEIKRTSDIVSKLTGMAVPGNKAVVGKNAFAHESGIHQDGVLKEKTTYEIISPEMVGVSSNSLVLGKHSGRHAFGARMKELGFALDEKELKRAFDRFKDWSEKKKEFTDADLLSILMEEKAANGAAGYELLTLQVQFGTSNLTTAAVTLRDQNKTVIQEAATGAGSVEAIYNTLERCIGSSIHLKDYRIQSNSSGRDALAEVYVKVEFKGVETSGRGMAQDVLEASARAYVNAVNRVLLFTQEEQEVMQLPV
ncbi:2-isopropylmalate synthase [Bacillus sp. FJAT-42376]|uniref:2-isopropylmalate synthase n=1 Tax=Bacillus sp. FJAT-42376 TaxID=2014076 RepID=UPI000F4E6B0C|nr:2-isopropylmalate synthase [Bacillus sp. FJAT-42376]AZB43841.1 2-isopropylmalate synthase [Bacillus sp. FJAT-42376]